MWDCWMLQCFTKAAHTEPCMSSLHLEHSSLSVSKLGDPRVEVEACAELTVMSSYPLRLAGLQWASLTYMRCSWGTAVGTHLAVIQQHTASRQVFNSMISCSFLSQEPISKHLRKEVSIALCLQTRRLRHQRLSSLGQAWSADLCPVCALHWAVALCTRVVWDTWGVIPSLLPTQTPHTGPKIHSPRHSFQGKHQERCALDAKSWLHNA